jgi:hypothetical protein
VFASLASQETGRLGLVAIEKVSIITSSQAGAGASFPLPLDEGGTEGARDRLRLEWQSGLAGTTQRVQANDDFDAA